MEEKTFYLEVSLSLVLQVSESKKEDLVIKVNKCIEELLKNQKSIQVSSELSLVSEEQLFAEYSASIGDDWN